MTKPKKFKKYPLVVIEWYDHAGEGGWVDMKDLEEDPILAKTVGWLVKEDELRQAIVRFGSANNRRVCYILELDKDPNDDTQNGGVNPLLTADANTGINMHFVSPWGTTLDKSTLNSRPLPPNPAIFETEPKEKADLDIYYEASQAIPCKITDVNSKNEIFAPIKSSVWCNKLGSMSGNNKFGDVLLTDWSGSEGNIATLSPGLNVSLTAYEVEDPLNPGYYMTVQPTSSLQDQTNWYKGEAVNNSRGYLRFYRDDLSYTTGRIESVEEIVGDYVTKVKLVSETNQNEVGLSYYNCIAWNNGVESNRLKDIFNNPFIKNGVRASTVLEEQYEEEERKYGLIYSGLYNSTSGINNLNQFIQADKITKDLNPSYGSIQKLHTRDTNLIALCEDKCLKVLVQKDALFNADGNPQLLQNKGY